MERAHAEVETAMAELALLTWEYLFFVAEIMQLYGEYVENLRADDLQAALENASCIVGKIELERSCGILKV